jgi:ABC-2 type transport system permease protein
MLKLFIIGIKDLKIIFRDRAALIMMLLAPFLLTLGMGLVTGRFSGSSNTGISDIPVIIVNLDQEQLGNALEEVFTGEELAELVEPTISESPEAARKAIDEDTAAAAIIIPAGFTRSVIPQQGEFDKNPSRFKSSCMRTPRAQQVQALSNPSWMNSSAASKKGASADRLRSFR